MKAMTILQSYWLHTTKDCLKQKACAGACEYKYMQILQQNKCQ